MRINKFKDRLIALMAGGSARGFAKKCGLSEATIRHYLSGTSEPTLGKIEQIAEACEVTVGWLAGEGEKEAETYTERDRIPLVGLVPLISWVQAGDWTEIVNSYHPGDAEEWFAPTRAVSKHAFALRVSGDSMAPRFNEGDVIIVDPEREALSGRFVVVRMNSDEATFKQLVIDGGNTYLKPINERYPLIDVTNRELRIVGVVTEKRELL